MVQAKKHRKIAKQQNSENEDTNKDGGGEKDADKDCATASVAAESKKGSDDEDENENDADSGNDSDATSATGNVSDGEVSGLDLWPLTSMAFEPQPAYVVTLVTVDHCVCDF